jgi:predicted transcriptional regulator
MNDNTTDDDLIAYTTEIVSAHLANNNSSISEIPALIEQVYKTLATLRSGGAVAKSERPEPAVSINKSVRPDYIICLEDGKKLKMLKRHLMTAYNMTPEQYRERWNLPSDYPMVAPNYAKQRSMLAKDIGLGRKARPEGGRKAKRA